MKMHRSFLITVVSIVLFSFCSSEQTQISPKLSGNYIGQTTPTDSSLIFAEGLISTEFIERDAAFSPDGNDFFYSLKGPKFYSLIQY